MEPVFDTLSRVRKSESQDSESTDAERAHDVKRSCVGSADENQHYAYSEHYDRTGKVLLEYHQQADDRRYGKRDIDAEE